MKQTTLTRREFLQKLGLIVAGLALAPVVKSFLEERRKRRQSILKEARHYGEARHLAG